MGEDKGHPVQPPRQQGTQGLLSCRFDLRRAAAIIDANKATACSVSAPLWAGFQLWLLHFRSCSLLTYLRKQ